MTETAKSCGWCGTLHQNTVCPRAKAIDYYQDGTVKRVEFWEPVQINYERIDVDSLLGRKIR